MDSVKVFHARAAVTQNARSPIVEREVRGTISSDVDTERNRLREATLYSPNLAGRRDSVAPYCVDRDTQVSPTGR